MAEFRRLFDVLDYQLKKFPLEDALCRKQVDGGWVKYSTEATKQVVDKLSIGLLAAGIKKDDKIAIISGNRPEWNFLDLALLQIGAVNVPIYPTITPKEYRFIFNDAEIKMCFVENEELYKKVKEIEADVESLIAIYSINDLSGVKNWKQLVEAGEGKSVDEVRAISDTVDPMDLATIIYTSGTTGTPKGVMLSHNNIAANVRSVCATLPLEAGNKNLSFLPLCHIFERTVIYTYMYSGCRVYYCDQLDKVADFLKEVGPHYFSTVPRLLEKVFDKIMATGNALTGTKRKLFFWAMDLGQEWDYSNKGFVYNTKLALARKLIFSKWKEALGGNVLGIITGAAALQARLERVFNAAGIPVKQGYGMTETSPVLTISRFDESDARIGTVGRAIDGVEIKIDPKTKEICGRGPNIMMGYYKRPDATAEVIDSEGWMHTGDCGEFIDGKYLKITDRIKQLFKTSGGKYVAPGPIENKFAESTFIEQIMITGIDRKFVGALITPSVDALTTFCKEKNLDTSDLECMCSHAEVLQKFQEICDEYNVNFSKVEKVKRFKILPTEWTIEGGEMTPTMKPKKKFIREKYASEIEEIYDV